MLFELVSDIVKIDDILLVVRGRGAVGEIRSNSLEIRQKDKWITIGSNDGPAHIHLDSECVSHAEFVVEEKPDRTSYSIRFYDDDGERVLAAFFTGMYDQSKSLNQSRKKLYEQLREKFGSHIEFKKNTA